MLQFLLGLVNPIKAVGEQLTRAYELKLHAQNDQQRIEAEKLVAKLEAHQNILIAEQGSWMTRWIRPALAAPVVIYIWKLVVWDTVLGWGVTPNPGEFINWYVLTVTGAYFLTRPIEKWGRRQGP